MGRHRTAVDLRARMLMGSEDEIKVILVDDHPVVLEGLALGLSKKAGLVISGKALDFDTGRQLVEREEFDLLVTDLYIDDECTGLDLLRIARELKPQSKAVVLTYSTNPEDVFAANEAGAHAYLIKDSELGDIAKAFRLVMDGGRPPLPPSLEAALWERARKDGKQVDNGALNERELEVLRHMANGLLNKEIAAAMFISNRAVRRINTSIFRKLRVRNRSQAVAKVLRDKII